MRELYVAEVINNDDQTAFPYPGREGRVQIYVEPLMKDWTKTHYPWARPFNGNNADMGNLDLPDKGSKVWVFCEKEDLKKNWYFLGYASFKKANLVQKITTFISSKLKLSVSAGGLGLSGSYPNIKFTYYKNGIVIGVTSSTSTPEVFVYHPEGSFISIDKSGNITTKGDWKHYGTFTATEEITAMAETDATKVTLSKHTHTSGSPGTPTASPTPGN